MTRHLVALSVVAFSVLLALAGCSGSQSPPTTAAPAPVAVVDAPVLESAAFAYVPMPSDVRIASAYHVRDDRLHTTKTGVLRRRSVLELLEQDPATVGTHVAAQLAAAGYKPIQVKDKGDGITRRAFGKTGAGRINVNVSSDVGDKPHHPDAIGIISFSWPAAEAPVSPVASAATTARE